MDELIKKNVFLVKEDVMPFDISEIHKYQKKVDGWDFLKDEKKIFF
jgi:4a-hydroxytetrahydrobiopterin dehydratase